MSGVRSTTTNGDVARTEQDGASRRTEGRVVVLRRWGSHAEGEERVRVVAWGETGVFQAVQRS